jgi:Na+-driven multidrug efflux pump
VTAWSFVVMGVMMVLGGTMRAYGVVVMPLIVMIVSLFPGRIGFYYLAYPHIGSEAVWWASPVGTVISALLTWAYYASGRWRRPGAAEIVPLRAE